LIYVARVNSKKKVIKDERNYYDEPFSQKERGLKRGEYE